MALGYQVLVPACFKQVPVFTPNSPRWYQCPTGYTGVFIESYALMPEAQQYLDPMGQPFDYVFAGSVWGLAFTTVVGLYLVAHSAGAILNFIRRG